MFNGVWCTYLSFAIVINNQSEKAGKAQKCDQNLTTDFTIKGL